MYDSLRRLLTFMLLVLYSTALAADSLTECRAIADADARLGCYDSVVDTRANDNVSFGRREKASGSDSPERLEEVVTGTRRNSLGQLIIELANGQIWQQVDNAALRLRAGDAVRVRLGIGTSYYLSKQSCSRSLKVRRVD